MAGSLIVTAALACSWLLVDVVPAQVEGNAQ
jgi:hypothetical protein